MGKAFLVILKGEGGTQSFKVVLTQVFGVIAMLREGVTQMFSPCWRGALLKACPECVCIILMYNTYIYIYIYIYI